MMFGAAFKLGDLGRFARQVMVSVAADERKRMAQAAAYIMRAARGRIRTRKAVSAPGDSPSSHTGLLRNNIFFAVDPDGLGAFIGPQALPDRAPIVPGILEFGGTLPAGTGRGRYDPTLTAADFLAHGYGPIEATGWSQTNIMGHAIFARGGQMGDLTNTAYGKINIRRGRIRTARQADRAANIYHGLKIGARPAGRAITIAARPYMNPALEASLPYVADILAGAR